MPSCFLMTFSSDLCTSPSWRKLRLRLGLFFSRMWRLKALARLILPVPVSLNRFAVPLCVLTLGICSLLFLRVHGLVSRARIGIFDHCLVAIVSLRGLHLDDFFANGRHEHEHVAPLEFGLALHERDLADLAFELLEDREPALCVDHLTAAEHDRDLDLRASFQEAHDVLLLGLVVVLVDLRSELDLFDLDPSLVLAGLLCLLFHFVLVLAVVHDLADWRVRT